MEATLERFAAAISLEKTDRVAISSVKFALPMENRHDDYKQKPSVTETLSLVDNRPVWSAIRNNQKQSKVLIQVQTNFESLSSTNRPPPKTMYFYEEITFQAVKPINSMGTIH